MFLIGREMGIVVDEDWMNPYTFEGRCIFPEEKKGITNILYIRDVIPLLHWEKLEEILESVGYFLEVEKLSHKNCECLILKGMDDPETECIAVGSGKTRQEAVMRAIVILGDKIETLLK